MNSFIAYLGGKSKLADTIVSMMPPHRTYCEVFAGAAWVFFKKEPSRGEIINDLNGELVNLYKVVKHHLPELSRYFKTELISRSEYVRLKQADIQHLTDVQRAARYYFLLRHAFGARMDHPSFTTGSYGTGRMDVDDVEKVLTEAHKRLNRTIIENLGYQAVIKKYDSDRTLFYLDPPYWGGEDDYGKGMFERSDYQRLADILKDIKGKFLLSINDVPDIREIFKEFNLKEVNVRYSASISVRPIASELIITNY